MLQVSLACFYFLFLYQAFCSGKNLLGKMRTRNNSSFKCWGFATTSVMNWQVFLINCSEDYIPIKSGTWHKRCILRASWVLSSPRPPTLPLIWLFPFFSLYLCIYIYLLVHQRTNSENRCIFCLHCRLNTFSLMDSLVIVSAKIWLLIVITAKHVLQASSTL